ncbi:MAG: site-specific integrase [Cellulomonas sp.]
MIIAIDEARARVVTHWTETDQMRPQSIEKFNGLLARFGKFASRFDVHALADVDERLVARFVRARGRNRQGQPSDAAVATMHVRRAVLRAFYRTARELQLTLDDPARDITLPKRLSPKSRPVTPAEADLLFMHAWSGGRQTRHAATIALMLSGAHSSEVGHIVASDLDPDRGVVRAHGSVKYLPRDLTVDPRHMRALVARRDLLVGRLPGVPLDSLVLATGACGSDGHKQARVCTTVREVLVWAGISDWPPRSITAVAGAAVFASTGRIDAAALTLGMSSLDSAASAIGWDWRTDGPVPRA